MKITNFLNLLQEDFKVLVSTPEKLLKWMDVIEYGWMDKKFKKYYNFDEWYNKVYFHNPKETFKHKIGTCYEQTIFEYHVFSNQFKEYELKMFHIQQFYVSNHSFLMFKKNDKWYHFEHSFYIYRGIHGPFNNINEAMVPIKKFMIKTSKQNKTYKNKGFNITKINPKNFKKSLTAKQFLDNVGYIWTKQEEL